MFFFFKFFFFFFFFFSFQEFNKKTEQVNIIVEPRFGAETAIAQREQKAEF
jgi:hypothetical protein